MIHSRGSQNLLLVCGGEISLVFSSKASSFASPYLVDPHSTIQLNTPQRKDTPLRKPALVETIPPVEKHKASIYSGDN